MAKVTTGPLRGSGKSDKKKVTRVTRLLRSSGKSDRKKVARVARLLRSSGKSDKKKVTRVARLLRSGGKSGRAAVRQWQARSERSDRSVRSERMQLTEYGVEGDLGLSAARCDRRGGNSSCQGKSQKRTS